MLSDLLIIVRCAFPSSMLLTLVMTRSIRNSVLIQNICKTNQNETDYVESLYEYAHFHKVFISLMIQLQSRSGN